MEKSNNERLAVLETTVKNLDDKVTEIQLDVKAIINTLSMQPSLETKIINLENKIAEVTRSTGLWKWLAPTLTGILTSILSAIVTFLVISYFQNVK